MRQRMDASFVYGETPNWHMYSGTLFVLDPSTAPSTFGVQEIADEPWLLSDAIAVAFAEIRKAANAEGGAARWSE